jgi:hypothetical protein
VPAPSEKSEPPAAAVSRQALRDADNQLLVACLTHNKAEVSRLLALGANAAPAGSNSIWNIVHFSG